MQGGKSPGRNVIVQAERIVLAAVFEKMSGLPAKIRELRLGWDSRRSGVGDDEECEIGTRLPTDDDRVDEFGHSLRRNLAVDDPRTPGQLHVDERLGVTDAPTAD